MQQVLKSNSKSIMPNVFFYWMNIKKVTNLGGREVWELSKFPIRSVK